MLSKAKSPDWNLEDAQGSWLDFDILIMILIWSWYTHVPNFDSLSWFLRCKEHPCPLSPNLGLWRMLEVPDCGLVSWSWFGYGHWSLIYSCSKFWLSILILKVQRTSMSFKSWFGALEDAGGSWLGFGILILIWIGSPVFDTLMFQIFEKNIHVLQDGKGFWLGFGILILIWIGSLVFGRSMFQILVLYLDFEGAKNIYVIWVLILGFGGCWRLLTGVWHLYLDLDMITGHWYTHDLNFGYLSWFWRCKEHLGP